MSASNWAVSESLSFRNQPLPSGSSFTVAGVASRSLLTSTTSPVEGALVWSIQKRRREDGGFPGAERIQRELKDGPARLRVGLAFEGRAPAREGAEIATKDGTIVGRVTSGGFGPTLGAPMALGYVPTALSTPGTKLDVIVRGKPLAATVVTTPFVPQRYVRKTSAAKGA